MKKAFLRKIISAVVAAATITTLIPLGVSAQWNKATDSTWSYTEGNQEEAGKEASNSDSKAKVSSGWNCNNGIWYYNNNSGEVQTGWIKDNNTWYYCNNSGAMQKGWVKVDGNWYYFDKSGKMQTGWIKDKGKWYFADSTGARQTGVIKIDGKTYYFNKSGVMQTGKVRIGNKTYKFAKSGEAIGNRIPQHSKEFDSKGNLVNSNDSDNNEGSNNNGSGGITTPQKPEVDEDSNGSGDITEPEVPDDNNGESNDNGSDGSTTPDNPETDEDSNGSGDITEPEVPGDNNQGSNGSGSGDTTTPNNPDNNQGSNGNGGTTGGNNNTSTNGTSVDINGLDKLPQKYPISIQSSAENKILELMNEKRVAAGLQPLTMDNTLLQVARYKSNHMIQYNYFDHTNPDGTKWTNWLKTLGYKYTATAENIAYNSYDPVQLFNQWWNSSGHRQNMMNPSYTKVGIGVIQGNNKYMGTQTFSN